MKFTDFVYFPWQLESVDECCKASPTTLLTLGTGLTHLFCLQSTAVWVVAVKQHFAEHTRERSNRYKFLRYWPGCLSNCCGVGKKRYGRLPPKHEGGKELNGPCLGVQCWGNLQVVFPRMLLNGFRSAHSLFSGWSCRWCVYDFAIWTLESISFKLKVADLNFLRKSIFCDSPFCRHQHRCFCLETCSNIPPTNTRTGLTYKWKTDCGALGFQLGEGRWRLDRGKETTSSCSVTPSFTRTAKHPSVFSFPCQEL